MDLLQLGIRIQPEREESATLDVQMNEENAPLNEKQTVDLTSILMNNDSPEISVEMDLNIGKGTIHQQRDNHTRLGRCPGRRPD